MQMRQVVKQAREDTKVVTFKATRSARTTFRVAKSRGIKYCNSGQGKVIIILIRGAGLFVYNNNF